MNKRIVGISLFSGAGGLDIAAHQVGIDIAACIDIDSDSIETLKINPEFKNTSLINASIVDFPTSNFKNILRGKKYDKLVLFGGPPCQPFSKAGYWIGNKNRKIDNDPRNMVGHYIRVLKELRPDGFLFENVDSLFHPTNKKVIEDITESLTNLNYNYKIIRANALDYGVPQIRRRVFIMGSRKKMIGDGPSQTHCKPEQVKEMGLLPHEGVGKFIAKYASDKYKEREEITSEGTYYKELKMVPPGKNYIALCTGKNPRFKKGGRFWNFLLKLHPDKYSWTIAAQPGPWVGPFHWTSRRLRIPEIAAIQTFPDNYKFFGSRRSVQRQIGNAVPPKLANKMFGYLIKNI